MSETLPEQKERVKTCPGCRQPLTDGKCLNVNCERAQTEATRGAARRTAKAAAPGARAEQREPRTRPRAVNLRGNVD